MLIVHDSDAEVQQELLQYNSLTNVAGFQANSGDDTMPNPQIITSDKAPKALGPYSHAVRAGHFIYTSGQIGLDPKTNELVEGIEAQTRQALQNQASVLAAAGTGLGNVVKTTVFLQDMGEFAKMNAVYAEFFAQNPPARSTVQAAALPKGAKVEIECVAVAEA
jgi:2-iminobutanoate/2-iminopropanoate deaminase